MLPSFLPLLFQNRQRISCNHTYARSHLATSLVDTFGPSKLSAIDTVNVQIIQNNCYTQRYLICYWFNIQRNLNQVICSLRRVMQSRAQ